MLASIFQRASTDEKRALQVLPWGPWRGLNTVASGVNVNVDTSLQLLTVYACIAFISDVIATLPQDVFRTGAERDKAPTPRWLEQPSDRYNIVEFISQALMSLLLDGNAYFAYALDRSFMTQTVVVLDPALVYPHVENGQVAYYVRGERYAGKLLHLKGLIRPEHLKGISPLEAARQTVGNAIAGTEFAGKFYSNSTVMSGVIEVPGQLAPDQAKIMADSFKRRHQGLANAHEPGVLTGGAQWKPISITPEQAQFLESRKYSAGEIAGQMFRLDPTLLGIPVDGGTSLTYANLEQRGIHLTRFTLLPWITRLERAFSFLLPKPQEHKFNVAGLERADLKTRYDAYRVGLGGAPFLLQEEVREREDLPKVAPSAFPVAVPPPPSSADKIPAPKVQV